MSRTANLRERGLRASLCILARLLETHRGLLTLIWFLRFAALLGLGAYFVTNRSLYSEQILSQVRIALLAFLAYVTAVGVVGVYQSEWFVLRKVKLAQVVIEIGLYSLFYYLTGDPRSEVYLLYLLPLFVAVRYLGIRWTLAVLGMASIGLYVTIRSTAASFEVPSTAQVYVYRELFMVAMTLFYALRRRPSVLEGVREEGSLLMSILRPFDDGVYVVDKERRLLFVNNVLQSRHGPYTLGQACFSYFMCKDQLCRWHPSAEHIRDLEPDDQKGKVTFVDQDGHPYPVEISCRPLPDETGRIVGAITFVRDVSKQQQLKQQLAEQLQRFAKRVQALTSERTKWMDAYYEMGKRLAGFSDLQELMRFVVDEAKDRLDAETSALFLLESDRLIRKAIAGVESHWFAGESYGVGEGITGQAVVSKNGAKYGEPIRTNNVDENPLVIRLHLAKYRERLNTHEAKHLIAVPLNGQERSFGVLRVVNKLDHKGEFCTQGFQQDDEDFLVTIASMAAIAIENARLLSQAMQRLREISALYSVGQRIAQTLNLPELLQVIVDEARQTIPSANKAIIHLIDSQRDMLVSKAVSPADDPASGLPPLNLDESVAGRAIKQRQVVYVPDTREAPDFSDRGTTLLSLLVAPLIVDDEVIGTLSVDGDQPDAFTPDNQQLLATLAAYAAIAIKNARLFQQEQDKRRLSDTLREVARIANSSLDLEQVLQHILNELGKVVAYDSTSIHLVDGNRLKIIACRGFDEPDEVTNITFSLDDPKFPNYRVLANKAPCIVNDVRFSYPHFMDEARQYHSGRIRSWLGVPLIHRDRVIGMISIDSETPDYYTKDSASLALTFANQVAIAIVNARLFQQTQKRMKELDTLHQASQAITSSLDIAKVLSRMVSLAGKVADSDHTGVVLVGEDGRLITSVEDHKVGVPLHVRARPLGITRQVIHTRNSIFFDEVQDGGVTHNPVIIEQGYRSYGGVPIMAQGKVQGVLFVHSLKPNAFRGYGPLLSTFCNQAAIAIENARFYREAEQQAKTLERLVEASRRLIEHTSMKELCSFCADTGAKVFDVEDCSLYVISEERHTVDLVASSGIPEHVWAKREAFIDGPGLTVHVARTGEALNFGGDEFKEHRAWAGRHEEPFLEPLEYLPSNKCHSLLIGPLVDSKGNRVGVLKLENKCGEGAGRRFLPFEVAMHKTFASHVGIAIERARLFQRLDEEARHRARESLSDDLHDTMNVLHGTLVLGTAYARELMDRGDYAAVVSQVDEMMKAAKRIYQSLRRVHQDVRDPILQDKGLIPALRHYANMLPITDVRFQTIGRAKLPSDIEYALYKIAQEALGNVAKHAELGENGDVQVRLRKSREDFQLIVSDNGVGFDVNTALDKKDAFGFQNMDRWTESIGARLGISSQTGRGTQVCIHGCLEEVLDNGQD